MGVVGASARAAVHSLARAGIAAWAVDLFSDRDLARVAPCVACPSHEYPAALPRLARNFPPGPVLYTGGLENHPAVVAELAADRELWGNPPAVLESVRDPHRLFPALAAAGFATPALAPRDSPCPATGRWLRKPLRSSAGHGICFGKPGDRASDSHYFQQYLTGATLSAVFVDTNLFGVTAQLVGEPWVHAKPFGYCGSIGPAKLDPGLHSRIAQLGRFLVAEFGLRGAWNADFVTRNQTPFVVEVNPRYSASVEVLEHVTRRVVWPPHPVSCLEDSTPGASVPHAGKAIYFAPRGITFPNAGPWDADLAGEFDPWRLPAFADIPTPDTSVAAGQPVLTLLVSGSSPAECRESLQLRTRELDQLFSGHPS